MPVSPSESPEEVSSMRSAKPLSAGPSVYTFFCSSATDLSKRRASSIWRAKGRRMSRKAAAMTATATMASGKTARMTLA